jgi:hypothetical protein
LQIFVGGLSSFRTAAICRYSNSVIFDGAPSFDSSNERTEHQFQNGSLAKGVGDGATLLDERRLSVSDFLMNRARELEIIEEEFVD